MPDDVRIRPAEPGDEASILDLMRLSLGEGGIPRSRAYWAWKHEDNPFGPSPCLLATVGDEVVGLRVFMRWRWNRDGRSYPAVRAVDTATHPDWRGQGIFSRLTKTLLGRMADEGVAFVFNTPNQKSRPGYLKMGWEDVGRVSLWVRALRPGRLLVRLLRDRAAAPDGSSEPTGRPEDPGADIPELLEQADLVELLAASQPPSGRFATPRTREYLGWRYGAVPGIRYRAVWHLEGATGAVLVFRTKRRGSVRELRFCEILVGPGTASTRFARGLVRDVMRETRVEYATSMTVTGARPTSVLGALGFAPAPRMGPIMTVRRIDGGPPIPDLVRRSAWHTSTGDLELF